MIYDTPEELYRYFISILNEKRSRSIIQNHGRFNSNYEAYAALLEEYDEAEERINSVKKELSSFWYDVKYGGDLYASGAQIFKEASYAAAALIQLMALLKEFSQDNEIIASHKRYEKLRKKLQKIKNKSSESKNSNKT